MRTLIALSVVLLSTHALAQGSYDVETDVTCSGETQVFHVKPRQVLLITDLAVVNAADAEGLGAWSFGRLMTQLTPAGYPGGPAGFTRDWLANWERNQTVGADTAPRVTN